MKSTALRRPRRTATRTTLITTAAALGAVVSAAGAGDPCGTGDSCFVAQSTPGCIDVTCCSSVCGLDPFCCSTAWDVACAKTAGLFCLPADPCASSGHDCFSVSAVAGCNDASCCSTVCSFDPYCCSGGWDGLCVGAAELLCAAASPDLTGDGDVNASDLAILLGAWGPSLVADFNGDSDVNAIDLAVLLGAWGAVGSAQPPKCPGAGSCWEEHDSAGCSDAACCETVCAADPSCCDVLWDAGCAVVAEKLCVACCQHELKLLNALPDIATVVVTPLTPAAVRDIYCLEDPEDWSLSYTPGGSYVLAPGTDVPGGVFPASALDEVDAELIIDVDRLLAPTQVRVEFFDAQGVRQKESVITLECVEPSLPGLEDFVDQYDWLSKSVTVQGAPDGQLFAGAMPAPCDSFDADDEDEIGARKTASCTFTYTFICIDGINSLKVTPPPDPDNLVDCWEWSFTDSRTGKVIEYSTVVPQSINYALSSGAYDIEVNLKLCTNCDTPSLKSCVSCGEQFVDVCLAHPAFTAGKPVPKCRGLDNHTLTGFNVTFAPDASTAACKVESYTWDYGDGTTETFTNPNVQATSHQYGPAPATYMATLTTVDAYGSCTRTSKSVQVTILDQCSPSFTAEYTWCLDEPGTNTVVVTFRNTSTEFCDTHFFWRFGDLPAIEVPNDGASVTHTYTGVPLSGQSFPVTLRMTDGQKCPGNGVSTTTMVELKPVNASLLVCICPDTTTSFEVLASSNATLTWDLPPGCEDEEIEANKKKSARKIERCFPDENPAAVVTATIKEPRSSPSVTAMCVRSKTFAVNRTCFPWLKMKGRSRVTLPGIHEYRVKWRDKIRLAKINCSTTVRGKTKFQKRTLWTWFTIRTDNVDVDSNHVFRERSGSDPCGCGCDLESTIGNGEQHKTNTGVAKFVRHNTGGPLRRSFSDFSLIEVVHYGIHAGDPFSVTVQKLPGLEVKKFNFTFAGADANSTKWRLKGEGDKKWEKRKLRAKNCAN